MNLNTGDTKYIISVCKKHGLLRNQAAYVLATTYHETARTMKPIRERGGEDYLQSKRYYPWVGRGYVQLTWKSNYKKASDKLGVNFIANPSLLLHKKYAAEILVRGMKEGWFTGKALHDYITLTRSDFVGARRIINGTDKASTIAAYAARYDIDLEREGYGAGGPVSKLKPQYLLIPLVAAIVGFIAFRIFRKKRKDKTEPVGAGGGFAPPSRTPQKR